MKNSFAICFSLLIMVLPASAEVKVPAIFSDNMVLQQGMKGSVWGSATPKEHVTVKIAGKSAEATAGADGKWSVKLDSLAPQDSAEMTISGSNTLTIHNVAVGEVWVGSGQSNMNFRVNTVLDAEKEIAAANYPAIRMFSVDKLASMTPRTDCTGKWEVCSPATVGDYSAVAYFFARELHQKLKVPIGIFHTSWGGTPARAWTPHETLMSSPELKTIVDDWQHELDAAPQRQPVYDKEMTDLKARVEAAKAAGTKTPHKKPVPPATPDSANAPSILFNSMVAPLIPYTIRGVIWYQGEADTVSLEKAENYRTLFPALITGWRQAWGEGDFPFLFVQLAGFMRQSPEPSDSKWARLRESQAMTLKVPKTGMAVAIDVGDPANIHPHNKQAVGHRLAVWAEAAVYGDKTVITNGPTYASMRVNGDQVRVTFKDIGGGLIDHNEPPLQGFAVAGADRKFVWADATIEGNDVVLHSDKVKSPVAVRYAWGNTPPCDLFNKANLPAVPFRTDDWEPPVRKPRPTNGTPEPTAEPAEND